LDYWLLMVSQIFSKEANLYLILISLCIFPSIGYSEGASSLGLGLFIWSSILIIIHLNLINSSIFFIKDNIIFYTIYLLLVVHFLITIIINNFSVNFDKSLYSIIILPILVLASYIFYTKIKDIKDQKLNSVLHFILFNFLLILLFSFFWESPFFKVNAKAIIFFAEPSHLAVIFAPFFLYSILTLDEVRKRFLIIIVFIIITIINNATLFIVFTFGIALYLIINFKSIKLIKSLLIVIIFSLILVINIDVDISYYKDRFIYDSNNLNMSLLVYLAGWERALSIMVDHSPIGVGFQQFGYEPLKGYFFAKLVSVGGGGLNIYDGATLGSKIIGEFGLVGLCFLFIYVYYFFNKILTILINSEKNTNVTIFFACVYLSFSIYLFVRGMGYFSELPFLFLSSLIFFMSKDFNNIFYEYQSKKSNI